jgi:DNA polymerase II large subunit
MAEYGPRIKKYFEIIDKELDRAYDTAKAARKKGFDPSKEVEIPRVENMAERVEGLVSVIAPQIIGSGISERISDLEKKYGSLDWRVSLIIALEIAQEKFFKCKDQLEAIDLGIRVGFAYHTMGTVSCPLEGIVKLNVKTRNDGKEYIAISYAGPIRSAGGTGASVSVLIVDYVVRNMGYSQYDPDEREVKRYSTELYDYHERITNLQYLPSIDEIEFMAKNLPVEVSGEPSERIEVSNYKDLPRVETNTIRNGVCLVMGEGLCQKAEKLWKQLSKWGKDFGMEHWGFLKEFIELKKKIKAKGGSSAKGDDSGKISPDYTFIKDLVAGRPVITHPMHNGGLRLRYGRARTSGYSSYCVHPASMFAMDRYFATGTQLKNERPGKGTTISPCDSIEGPIVLLKNGNVERVQDEVRAKEINKEVKEVLYLGDILINYGDFLNRAHKLVPPGYCEEWWVLELEKAAVDSFGAIDVDKISSFTEVRRETVKGVLENPLQRFPSGQEALALSRKLGIPLHPTYTYHYLSISSDDARDLLDWFQKANPVFEDQRLRKIVLPFDPIRKRYLELLGLPHICAGKEFVVIEKDPANVIYGLFIEPLKKYDEPFEDFLQAIKQAAGITVRDKNGMFIGARMGRPEKAKMRKLAGSPHVLFPVGDEGGRLRCFQSAMEAKKVSSQFPNYYCPSCKLELVHSACDICGKIAEKRYHCKICGLIPDEKCKKHPDVPPLSYTAQEIPINEYFDRLKKKLDTKVIPDLIKGVRGTSNKGHVPEHLIKGILRAKHGIFVNKDGTTRYDMTQLPITHFKPKEIGTSIDRLKELGYEADIQGRPLTSDEQVIEIIPQDLILPSCPENYGEEDADEVLYHTANFLDELLVSHYGLKPFYNLKTKRDIVGHLLLCLAPHTSGAILGRVIGFSQTQGMYGHPLIHAATRRDCDGDEACVVLVLDALLNFSRSYLPAHRGSTQDAPLVLTSHMVPAEVDDMVFDLDVAWKYGLDFYSACTEYKNPWEVKIDVLGDFLHTERQYEKMGYTHPSSDFNGGVKCSAYKTIPTMEDKLKGQMILAEKIRAVETSDVARLVIEKHFLKDLKGNIRKFSQQQFRCVKCNDKFRRPPLSGKCTGCGGKIIFTISEGSVIKYLEPSISLAEKYDVPPYLQQTLMLTKRRVEMMFGKEKERQEGLGRWFG